MTPDDRQYSKSHEWIRIEGDLAVVGITDYAQDAMGDVTFVELPAAGAALAQGGESGVIESVKAASDVYAPVTGTIAEVNTALEDQPELLNSDPYGEGWIFKLKDVDAAQVQQLYSAADYDAFTAQQS